MKLRSTAPLTARRGDPRGQVLVLFALMLVVLLLVSALAVDYGGWLVTRRNYQNVTDAAALAGAQHLTRPVSSNCGATGLTKRQCAKQAAWESVRTALGFTTLNPTGQALAASNLAYQENGYSVWVASPPSDANIACAGGNPLCIHSGTVYPGHVSGPGTVFVRVEKDANIFLSRIAGTNRQVAAWATAGRFPANFAVIGMCSPDDVTERCLAGDSNIKLDGTDTNLIVNTGDLGTNRWVRSGGTSSGVALGDDSNAYMQLYDSCWTATGNQCNLWGYNTSTGIDFGTARNAIPLGAPIQDPNYAAPTISDAATPNQCRGTGAVQLASAPLLERGSDPQVAVADLPIALARSVTPRTPLTVPLAAGFGISGTVSTAPAPGTLLGDITVQLINSSNNVLATDTTPTNGGNKGKYSFNNVAAGTYTVRAVDSTDLYFPQTISVTVGPDASNINFNLTTSPVVSGTVTSTVGGGGISGVTVTITALGQNYTTTTNGSGFYTRSIPQAGALVSYTINGAATGYTSNGGTTQAAPTTSPGTYANLNFTMTPAPGSLTGTITDQVTGLPVPGVVVTLSSGESATTNASGLYNIANTFQGTKTVTLSGTAIVATSGYAYSTPASGSTINVNGAVTQNFTVWPKGCYDGSSSGSFGSWRCDWPSGSNCPATSNPDAANVGCTFTQANAIRPGTYKDITISNGNCAWFDPKGGATGLATGQSGGIYHIKGNISIGNGSYLFGDGVTLVFDQNTNIDVGNSGGFVLNYGTHTSASACTAAAAFTSPYNYGDTGDFCFRTAGTVASNTTTATPQTEDRNYAAWTTKGHLLWSGTQNPVYSDDAVAKGSELGITFFLWCPSGNECGLGNNSRFKIATASMGYLFNGVLYGPHDDVQLGGGKDNQTAAGQLVGWTIEYHGGTRIQQNWYGDPQDGQPFLIEPVLGE